MAKLSLQITKGCFYKILWSFDQIQPDFLQKNWSKGLYEQGTSYRSSFSYKRRIRDLKNATLGRVLHPTFCFLQICSFGANFILTLFFVQFQLIFSQYGCLSNSCVKQEICSPWVSFQCIKNHSIWSSVDQEITKIPSIG